jgi:prolipoprotein diacylglyceryl transferase
VTGSPPPLVVEVARTVFPSSALAFIPPPPFQSISLGPLDLRMYGLLIAIGAYLALLLVVRRYESFGGAPDIAEKASLLALLGGFLGARIGYVIPRFTGPGGFAERPEDILAIWQGGLAFFGGLVGGSLAVLLYVRWKQGDIPSMMDAVAPALPLAQAIGRWGNYFNQELFGRPTDVPWALRVDPAVAERAGYPAGTTFHPTFLYESLWNMGLVLLLLDVDRRGWLKRRGSLLFLYLIGYGVGRGWIEALRIDTVERYLGLSRNNWIAIGVVLLGIVGLVLWERRGPAKPLPDDDLTEEALDAAVNDGEAADTEVADEPGDTELASAEPVDTEVADPEVAGGEVAAPEAPYAEQPDAETTAREAAEASCLPDDVAGIQNAPSDTTEDDAIADDHTGR